MLISISITRIFCSAMTLLLLSLPFAVRVVAQFETATVLGTVLDQNGSIVERANVTLKNISTGISSSALTDANGDFQFVNTKIGNYQITAEASGFAKVVADNVNVTVNARQLPTS